MNYYEIKQYGELCRLLVCTDNQKQVFGLSKEVCDIVIKILNTFGIYEKGVKTYGL